MIQTRTDRRLVAIAAVLLMLAFLLAGCAGTEKQVVIETQIIEKPVPVRVTIERPKECLDRYAVDNLPANATPDERNNAILAEIEQRAACEARLRAALEGAQE
jgi:hypothetical protein